MTLYNVVFTALTPVAIGIFDRDVDKAMALRFPGLYMQGGSRHKLSVEASTTVLTVWTGPLS
jgi:hypothetical protein